MLEFIKRFLNPIKLLLNKLILPGFDGVSIYEILRFFFKGLVKGAITMRASAVAFNFFLAIFPTIIFVFTIIPYLPIPNFNEMVFSLLQDVLPNSTYDAVYTTVENILTQPQGGLLSIGFVLALFFSTSGISSLIDAFNQTYHTIETRSLLKQQWISLILVLIISFLVMIGIALIIGGGIWINHLQRTEWIDTGFQTFMLQFIKWFFIVFIFFFTISFLYYLGPSRRQKFRFISAGSTLTTILIILLSIGFNYYIDNFSRYNTLYGSIGTLIVVMLWIYFVAIVILIGFELNASISVLKNMPNSKRLPN